MVNPGPRTRSSSRPRRSIPPEKRSVSREHSAQRGASIPRPPQPHPHGAVQPSPQQAQQMQIQEGREMALRGQLAELEADYHEAKSSDLAARNEVGSLRQQVDARDEELRKLKLHILQLSDYIDSSALQAEEEKHGLRKQIESESRSYRSRNHNMNQLVAQLRQDALDAKVRYDDLKHDYDKSLETKERLHDQIVRLEQQSVEQDARANSAEQRCSDMSHQRALWEAAEKTWVERVERAEALVLEMEKESAALSKENAVLRAEGEGLQINVEEQRLQLMQVQRREGDVRSALAEASASAEMLVTARRENEELQAREEESAALINELRIEKQKMMVHLQAGIRERQAVIDSLTQGDARGNTHLQVKIIEAEALKTELTSLVQRYEEEMATAQEYMSVLKAKAEAAEDKLKACRDDNRRLRAELELTRSQIDDVHKERDRAQALTAELKDALDEATSLRNTLQLGRDRHEQSLQEKVQAARRFVEASQSPEHTSPPQ